MEPTLRMRVRRIETEWRREPNVADDLVGKNVSVIHFIPVVGEPTKGCCTPDATVILTGVLEHDYNVGVIYDITLTPSESK